MAGPPPESVQASFEAAWLSSDKGLSITPLRAHITARPGVPIAVYFRCAQAVPMDRPVKLTSGDERVVRVVDHGDLMAGSDLGCAIVEGVAPGSTTVTVAGAPVEVEIRGGDGLDVGDVAPIRDVAGEWGGEEPARIIAPLDGAAAWGRISVSASWWRGDRSGDTAAEPPRLAVDGHPGSPLAPSWVSPPSDGPYALAAFDVDTTDLQPGPVLMRLVCAQQEPVPPRGRDSDDQRRPDRAGGSAVQLRVFHPAAADTGPMGFLTGECESAFELPELPPERKEGPPPIRKHDRASGGQFFDNSGASPHFRFPVGVPTDAGAGWYQVVLAAGGDRACGVWPAAGVSIDEAQYPATRSAIAQGAFHRVPIGTPIRLEPGRRVLRIDFLNDFYVAGGVDRNLRLDAIEVLRVADAAAGPAAEARGMMTMSGGAQASGGGGGGGDAMMTMQGAGTREPASRAARWPESAASAKPGDALVVAFARPLDGATVAGDLDVRAVLRWPGMNRKDSPPLPPPTRLMLNGRTIGTQVSAAPRFVIPFEDLRPGDNHVSLRAGDIDGVERGTDAVVRRPGGTPAPPAGLSAPVFTRLTVHDGAWDPASRERITTDQNPPERACLALFAAGELVLAVPSELAGDYEIDIEARGQAFRGPPELTVALESDGQLPPQVLGVLAVSGGWDSYPLQRGVPTDKRRAPAVAHLATGPKSLRIAFENDLYEPDKGDRNVFVQAVALRPVRDRTADPAVDGVTVLYPETGATVASGDADAAIVTVDGPVAPQSAVCVLDGEVVGAPVNLRGRPGPYLLPVSLRGVAAGSHRLEVRVTDALGRATTSVGRDIAAAAPGSSATRYQRAVHLLNRVAFGPDERELTAALLLGEAAYLDERLADDAASPRVRGAIDAAVAKFPNASNGGDVQRRAILEALATQNPVRARFVLWVENHFSTWIRKTEARRKADEHDRFTRLGVAPFGELLLASATSPAMLRYLDQEQSFARRLNENYAREIMELHTLGVHGGYTQQDVTTLARILTGWTTAREVFVAAAPGSGDDSDDGVGPDEYGMRESFRFDPALGDADRRLFLGRTFEPVRPEDRHRRVLSAIAMLASHPSTARFIAEKIAAHYAGFPPPEDLVEDLASTFQRSGGDMRDLLRTLANHPRFWDSPARLAHPPDFAFRLARVLGSTDAQAVHEYLNLTGRGMFDRSTPDGYQENDAESMDSNAMLQRWKFARRFETPLVDLIAPGEGGRAGDKPIDAHDAQATTDLIAIRLTGHPLGEASNRAALDLLDQTDGRRDERWRTLAVFIASTPEAQMK